MSAIGTGVSLLFMPTGTETFKTTLSINSTICRRRNSLLMDEFSKWNMHRKRLKTAGKQYFTQPFRIEVNA